MNKTFRRGLAALLVLGSLATGTALAQRGPDAQLLYELLNRMDQLEREVRQLRGELETYRYEQDRRIEALEEGQPPDQPDFAAPSPAPETAPADRPVGAALAPASRPPDRPPGSAGGEQQAYERAFDLLREGRYQEAVQGFQAFLDTYPDSPLAGTALYWLGEAHYITRDFAQAREAFMRLGQNYPQNDRLPDAMLRLGYTFQELGDRGRARAVLQELVNNYPGSQAARFAEQRLQELR